MWNQSDKSALDRIFDAGLGSVVRTDLLLKPMSCDASFELVQMSKVGRLTPMSVRCSDLLDALVDAGASKRSQRRALLREAPQSWGAVNDPDDTVP
jgi:hypothetical protein